MRLLVLSLLLFASGPAQAQTTGLCSAIADRAARLECLNRPADAVAAPIPQPAAQPRSQPSPRPATATGRACTPAAPCRDARGPYYTTSNGGKRYVTIR